MKTCLTIAGSDSIGGAGIQADIKTMTMLGVYGMTAIASLTSQNTKGVKSIFEVSKEFLGDQLDMIISDIFPDAVKTGCISSPELIKEVVEKIKKYQLKNIVVDPVIYSKHGVKLIKDEAVDIMKKELLPLAKVITPNILELEIIAEIKIKDNNDMVSASKKIFEKLGCAVLCKGGHGINDGEDLLYNEKGATWFKTKKIETNNLHGTGCTLSSAIASNLARGFSLEESISKAKEYLTKCLEFAVKLGKGFGPVNHCYKILNFDNL
jgi:hydroxymethylpyrimidine/phosphomethylpyrimidine kinase